MEQELITLLNRLAMRKYSDVQLRTMARKDHKNSSSAFDIFSDGVDSSEAMIALEIRKMFNENGRLEIKLNKVENPVIVRKDIERTIEHELPTLNVKTLEKYAIVNALKTSTTRLEAATKLGMAVFTLRMKVNELGSLEAPNLPEVNINKLKDIAINNCIVKYGFNKKAISRQTGLNYKTVCNHLKQKEESHENA